MYYETPKLNPYVSFIKKYRLFLISFIFLLGIFAFFSINPSLFSSDERIWLQDSLELERTENNNLESQHVSKITFHVNSFELEDIKKLKALDSKLKEVEDVTYRMNALIDTVQSTSSATVALLAYYPPENEQSFIGACFPYVDQLNENFRDMADLDPGVQVLETYGAGIPIIQKASPLGRDNYHPTPNGSEQMSFLIQSQLNL